MARSTERPRVPPGAEQLPPTLNRLGRMSGRWAGRAEKKRQRGKYG